MAGRGKRVLPLVVGGSLALALALLGVAGHATSPQPPGSASRPDGRAEAEPARSEVSHPGEVGLAVPDAQGPSDTEHAEASAGAADEPGPVATPVRVLIPAISVDAEIVPVGLRPDGAMEVPDFGLAGWYTKGPRPGEEGPAAVVAHVDSRAGPDVFFRLGELQAGDEVRIRREDGSTVTFEVERQEQTPKDRLPVDRIWGWTDEPTLRLITCDGFFDRSTGHYEDNRIVYLSLQSD